MIHRAHFAAAVIRYMESVRNDRLVTVETVGRSYLCCRGLLGSPCDGATDISYPTAVGSAILAWHTVAFLHVDDGELKG